jgi:hypothetical protein
MSNVQIFSRALFDWEVRDLYERESLGFGVYDVTVYNMTGYFNQTSSVTWDSTETLTIPTYQALLTVTAKQLFTNNSLTGFNVTNGAATNTTAGTSLTIPANNGSNNLRLDHNGNYSVNQSCTANSLTTTACAITGIYDNLFTVGARHTNGTLVSTFTLTATNATLGGQLYQQNTTNGTVVLPLLQGYQYYFFMNASSASLGNATLSANASTNLYNFSLYTLNTFNMTFRNETSNQLLTGVNITVQLISDNYANNYTTSTGQLEVTLLTPDDYEITYWREQSVPREYYTTLSPQSYNFLTLYVLDSDVSNIYLPVLVDQGLRPIGDATVTLLRYYIDCNCYRTVEMAKTDTNGQAVLRVVPNTIAYKLLFRSGSTTISTDPTKFTSQTNGYTMNLISNPLTSIIGIDSVSRSLTFNNATLTYTYTWSDTSNLVSSGCLEVTKFHKGTQTSVADSCSNGASGSIIYTLTDTNNTQYTATGSVNTNTEFSTYYDTLPVSFRTTGIAAFGIAGLLLGLFIMLVLISMGAETGTDTIIIMSIVGMLGLTAFGVISGTWFSLVPIIALGVIVMYKTRT